MILLVVHWAWGGDVSLIVRQLTGQRWPLRLSLRAPLQWMSLSRQLSGSYVDTGRGAVCIPTESSCRSQQ